MASTTALITGLSGLTIHSRQLEVIGNNISNSNTTSFKSNRILFTPTLSRNFGLGTAPGANTGGTNPGQVGFGGAVAGTQRNFSNGSVTPTGINTDLAMEGDGFFIVNRAGSQFYTRAGSFQRNSAGDLVTITGERVQGYAVDDGFNLVDGTLTDLNIPLGSLTFAEATQNIYLQGNLNADEDGVPTQGARIDFGTAFFNLTTGLPFAAGETLVDNLEVPAGGGVPLFPAAGAPYTYTIEEAMKGNDVVPTASLTIDATTTIDDFLEFLNDTLGIVDGLVNPDGATTGAQIDAAGNVFIIGNTGAENNITFDDSNVTITDMAGGGLTMHTLVQDQTTGLADGESIRTTLLFFDSLGTPLRAELTMVLEGTSATGTTWRYYVDSEDNVNLTDPDYNVGSGTISFDVDGRLLTTGPVAVNINRNLTGAEDPLVFDLHFDSEGSSVTSLNAGPGSTSSSSLHATLQDGAELGSLSSFSVGEDGMITGGFSNGRIRTIGQVAVALFTNPEGLIDSGGSLFRVGPNSGDALVTTPLAAGAGRTIGGALELSNVDLGQEFINMILTTTGYSAASRVITTTDQLLQQLVALGG